MRSKLTVSLKKLKLKLTYRREKRRKARLRKTNATLLREWDSQKQPVLPPI